MNSSRPRFAPSMQRHLDRCQWLEERIKAADSRGDAAKAAMFRTMLDDEQKRYARPLVRFWNGITDALS